MSETVFENGVFLGASGAPAEALLARDGRIAHIGTRRECRAAAAGPTPALVDLEGQHAVPGFTDAHVHTAQLALQQIELDLSGARSAAELCERLAGHLAGRGAAPGREEPEGWVFGGRWNHRLWPDQQAPSLAQLDAVSGATPVALRHGDLHTYLLNSAGLAALGIDERTPDPVGGRHERDASGRLTGVLTEAAAFAAERFFDGRPRAGLEEQLAIAARRFLAAGVTTVHDIDGSEALRGFRALRERGELPLRVIKHMPAAALDELIDAGVRTGSGDDWLRFGAIKIFGDGSLSSETCLLSQPYAGRDACCGGVDPGYAGIAVTPPAQLEQLLDRCVRHGFAAAIHAIGDRAITNALDAIERAAGLRRDRGERPCQPDRIEHVQHLNPADLGRLRALDVTACMQPESCTNDMDLVDAMLSEHPVRSYAWRDIARAGGRIAFSSDAPVEGFNPFHGIYAAVTRCRPDGSPLGGWQPEQRLSRAEAFACYTQNSAAAAGIGHLAGALATGRFADFAVLDRDPVSVDDAALRDTRVTKTVIGGAVRWSA